MQFPEKRDTMVVAKQNLIYAVIGVFFFFEGYLDFCIILRLLTHTSSVVFVKMQIPFMREYLVGFSAITAYKVLFGDNRSLRF